MGGQALQETIFYNEDSASPLTVLKPAGAQVDNLLVLVMSVTDGVLADITGAVGWADEGSPVDIAGQRCKVFSHVVGAGDPSSWAFGYNAGSAMAAALFRVSLADATPVIVVTSASTASNGSTMDSPTATPSGMDDINIAIHTNPGAGSLLSYVAPTGLTDLGKTQASSTFQGIAAAFVNLTSSSPTGAQTWTSISPTALACGTFTILIKSSGVYDPDPPLKPPAPEIPPWLLRELLLVKARRFVSSSGEPVIQEYLNGGASNANVTLTTHPCEVGDLLVAFHSNNFYTAAQLLAPTGGAGTWTKEATGDNGTNSAHIQVWTCPITSGGVKTVTFAPASDEEHVVHLYVISGADSVTPVDGVAGNNGAASTSHVAPAVSPTGLNGLLLCAASTTSVVNYTAPPNMFKRGEVDVTSFMTAATASKTLATSGSTGTQTFTSSASAPFAACSIVIQPPTGTVAGPFTVDVTDDVGLTDATDFMQSKVVTDDIGLTDTAQITQAKVVTDDVGLTDEATSQILKAVTQTDDVGLTDTTALVQSKVATDSIGLTDSAASTQSKVVTDDTGLTDSAAVQLTKAVTQTDDTGLTDSAAATQSKVVTDSAGLTDGVALTNAKVPTDSAGLTDSSTVQLTKAVTQTDDVGLTDTTATTQSKIITDSVGLTDVNAVSWSKVVTDSVGLTDSATAQLIKQVSQTDDVGLTDTAAFIAAYVVTDSVGLTDGALVSGGSSAIPVSSLSDAGSDEGSLSGTAIMGGLDG